MALSVMKAHFFDVLRKWDQGFIRKVYLYPICFMHCIKIELVSISP